MVDRVARIKNLKSLGHTNVSIASDLGISTRTLSHILRTYLPELKSNVISSERTAKIEKLILEGYSYQQIAEMIGVKYHAVRSTVRYKLRHLLKNKPTEKVKDVSIENEVWKPLIYNGLEVERCQVSNLGRVQRNGNILRPQKDHKGYHIVSIKSPVILGNKQPVLGVRVHRAVMCSFKGLDLDRPDVNHKNTIKTDNRIENLEWCTPQENVLHAMSNGLHDMNRKLTDNQVRDIRNKYKVNNSLIKLAKEYNVSYTTIFKVVNNIFYKWVK